MASTTASVALAMPRQRAIGSAPAAIIFRPSLKMRFGQDGGGRGAVAGDVVGLAGGFFDELGAEVLVRVVQLDVFGDGHAVFGHLGRAPALVEHGVAAAGAKRAANGPGQLRDAGRQRLPCFVVKHHLFCCHAKSSHQVCDRSFRQSLETGRDPPRDGMRVNRGTAKNGSAPRDSAVLRNAACRD